MAGTQSRKADPSPPFASYHLRVCPPRRAGQVQTLKPDATGFGMTTKSGCDGGAAKKRADAQTALRHGSLRRKTERRGAGPRRQEENLCQPEGWRNRCDAKLTPSGRGRRSRRGRHHRRHGHHHRRGHRRLHVRRHHHRRVRRHHDPGRRRRPHHLHGDALR